MKEATIIFPHQLFKKHPAVTKRRPIYLVELDYFFNRFSFHKQKIAFHHATMHYYQEFLKNQGYTVIYCKHDHISTITTLVSILKKDGIKQLHYVDPIEHDLNDELMHASKNASLSSIIYESPMFVTSSILLKSFFEKPKKRFIMGHFYRKQRIELQLLVNKQGNPRGGQWSFDELNREPLPSDIKIPLPYRPRANKYMKKAEQYVSRFYNNNPGELNLLYPVTHEHARRSLNDFLRNRLYYFGPYQDAISQEHAVLFHSQLSMLLNVGLLTPRDVIAKTVIYAKKHKLPINSLEGFIRQIIGWREFVYGIYRFHGKKQRKYNFWHNKRRLWSAWWKGKVGILPVDLVINRILKTAYAHHIERLMILGNFMALCEIDPNDVYRWFMELFIDAYDWVMIPNVYGMSQYADGGLMATKPYISSSRYIKRMSSFKSNEWEKMWDALFWYFMYKHKTLLKKNVRMAQTVSLLKRMKKSNLDRHKNLAHSFLRDHS